MKKVLLIIFIILLSHGSYAKNKSYNDLKILRIASVYDGDSISIDIEGVHPIIGENVPFRIYGYDTPELRDRRHKVRKKAYRAKAYLTQLIRDGQHFEIRNVKRGKYFRLVGDLYIDGKKVKDLMIKKRLARNYYGGKKINW